jgi:1-acyl-sn-glycerol-3-phosphate acyltransferase
MKIISGFILVHLLGWKIKGTFPDIKKSVVIFAPHTSYWDGLYGKLYLMQLDINYKFLSKKEFFKFPMKYFFIMFGSIPVFNNKEYIDYVAGLFDKSEDLHIVLSPEGQLAKSTRWKKGYYYMALKAGVPIVVGYLDYKKKEIGVKGVIDNLENLNTVMYQVNTMYKDVTAKYPENFSLEFKM